MKMPKNLKDRTEKITVSWGRALEYGREKSEHGLTLTVRPGDDPEKLRKQAQRYLEGIVDEGLEG